MQGFMDNTAIHEIVEQHRPMVYRIALQNTKNTYTADDITQNVFIKLLERDVIFESDEHLKAWLIKVTLNESRSYFRLAFVRTSVPLTEEDSTLDNINCEYISLFQGIQKLKKNYKNVLYLHCFEGYTVPEIAQILGKKINTISTWLRRARIELRKIIDE